MVSVGSKALQSRRHWSGNLTADSLMGEQDHSYNHGGRKKGKGRKANREGFGFDNDNSNKSVSGHSTNATFKGKNSTKYQRSSEPQTTFVRKQIDPETTKYFSEIANLFESNEIDLEERSFMCGNALEEVRGKELELATDYILSHTVQTLLEGCDVDHLCGFIKSCAKVFPTIVMDRSGSHVAETALKSLAMHLQDSEAYSVIEETVSLICKVIVASPVDVMCNCYGSHVLRRLLCLCKGVPLDSSELHGAKSSKVLATRLNLTVSRSEGNDSQQSHKGFPDLLNFLVSGILKSAREDIKALQVDQYSSLVLQTALRLLAGDEQELLQIIPILLGCNKETMVEGSYIETDVAGGILDLIKESAFSHLMEVVLEVSPENLYNDIFNKVFKNSLFELSSHHCGNFVVQALASQARSQDQMELMWKELGTRFKDLLEMGKSGVIASLIAASQRLHSHEHKCCQALATAVCSTNEPPKCIVPRILFLDSYFCCEHKSEWNWASGLKMHVMGSLILQEIFKFHRDLIQPYVTSITSMEAEHVYEAAKDAGGARVLEAFLGSNASVKQKCRLVMKLRGHFGELSLHPSGSFTVERCFTASNMSLREAIASELLAIRAELSKKKQGPHLLRRLDIEGLAAKPDQWRSRQAGKQSAYKEFYAAFGTSEAKSSKEDSFLSDISKQTSHKKELKNLRSEIDHDLGLVNNQRPFLSHEKMGKKRHRKDGLVKPSEKKLKV